MRAAQLLSALRDPQHLHRAPGAHHEDERVARGDERQQVGGRVLVVQHLHLALARPRRRLPPHRGIPHLPM